MGRKTALVTGSVALGALVTGSLLRRIRNLTLSSPADLAPAVESEAKTLEIMEGRARFYERSGAGVPVVLLHSISAAASTFEMKPIFERFTSATDRPVYALDWFGFGRSDRPPVRYAQSIYVRQLRRFLSEHVHEPVDLVALSLSCEYAAEIARSLPYLVRRLVLIGPTGLSLDRPSSLLRRGAVSMADSVGAFEIFFYRLTREAVLRRFYARQVFRSGIVPDELVAYASSTSHVKGAHHAARYFMQGGLSAGSALRTYAALRVPTLVVAPASTDGLIQQFDHLDELAGRNADFVQVARLPGGLLPQWEEPDAFFEVVEPFLGES